MGANAIIGMRYDATELMAGLTEVLCYATAVVAERDVSDAQAASGAVLGSANLQFE